MGFYIKVAFFSFFVYHFKITRHGSVFTFWLLIIQIGYYFLTFEKYQLNLDLFIINYGLLQLQQRYKSGKGPWGETGTTSDSKLRVKTTSQINTIIN